MIGDDRKFILQIKSLIQLKYYFHRFEAFDGEKGTVEDYIFLINFKVKKIFEKCKPNIMLIVDMNRDSKYTEPLYVFGAGNGDFSEKWINENL